jgi:hypothetical protein
VHRYPPYPPYGLGVGRFADFFPHELA